MEERGGGVQGNHVVRYSSIFTQQREEFIHKISWQTDLAKENIKSIKTRILTFQNYCFKIGCFDELIIFCLVFSRISKVDYIMSSLSVNLIILCLVYQ